MGEMKRRQVLPLILGALLLMPGEGGDALAAKTSYPRVAGTTRIVGDSTTAMWVEIPAEVQFRSRYGRNPDIQIEGGGRMAGFVLTQAPVDDPDREFVFAGRAGFCPTQGCDPNDTYQFMGASSHTAENRVVLPAGRYLLYLIADGAPVTITLRLHGLSRTTKLAPSFPVASSISVPNAETEMVGPERKAYWFGDSATIDGPAGLLLGALSVDSDEWVQGAYGSCIQRELREPPKVAYSFACPTGSEAWNVEGYATNPIARQLHHTSVWNVEPGGDWGIGVNYVVAADVKAVRALVFHMSYDVP